jgi:type 1 fimbriae regulatory protein FimB
VSERKNIGPNGAEPDRTQQNVSSDALGKRIRRRKPDDLKYLSTEELQRFFSVIKNKRDVALFRVMYHLGLRASEIGILDLGDFRQQEGRLKIKRLKGSSGGEYRLPDLALAALRSYVRYERSKDNGPLFLSRNGRGIHRTQVWRLAQGYGQLAGIQVHPHMFKHSCGTHLAEMGEDLLDIQDQLGHKSIANTRKYIEVTNKRRDGRGQRLRGWK